MTVAARLTQAEARRLKAWMKATDKSVAEVLMSAIPAWVP